MIFDQFQCGKGACFILCFVSYSTSFLSFEPFGKGVRGLLNPNRCQIFLKYGQIFHFIKSNKIFATVGNANEFYIFFFIIKMLDYLKRARVKCNLDAKRKLA